MKTKTTLSSTSLKEELWKTLKDVKAKRVTPSVANSVASQAREILKIVKTEIEIAKLSSSKSGKQNIAGFIE